MAKQDASLYREREVTLSKLKALNDKESVRSLAFVALTGIITYGAYTALGVFTDLAFVWRILITVPVALVTLALIFGIFASKIHREIQQKRKRVIESYRKAIECWLVSHGKNGVITLQGDILLETMGVKRSAPSGKVEFFTLKITHQGTAIK